MSINISSKLFVQNIQFSSAPHAGTTTTKGWFPWQQHLCRLPWGFGDVDSSNNMQSRLNFPPISSNNRKQKKKI